MPGGLEVLARWLAGEGFELAGVSPANIGHRFVRPVCPGPGQGAGHAPVPVSELTAALTIDGNPAPDPDLTPRDGASKPRPATGPSSLRDLADLSTDPAMPALLDRLAVQGVSTAHDLLALRASASANRSTRATATATGRPGSETRESGTRSGTASSSTLPSRSGSPEGLGKRARIFTVPPARTASAPASSTLISRAVAVPVALASGAAGVVHRPTVLGALVGKAAATKIPVRDNRERDWQDAALLLSLLDDPMAARQRLTKGDRRNLRVLTGLLNPGNKAWAALPPERRRLGQAAARLLLAAPAAR